MGIGLHSLDVLLQEAKSRPFSGSVLSIGVMDIHFGLDYLEREAERHGVALQSPADVTPAAKPSLAERGCISDKTFFQAMGFSEIVRLDVSSYEDADEIFDLNSTSTPEGLRERFDVVYNGGTLEHVFNVPEALKNLHKMTACGGRIIHNCPVSNAIDHGFYCFSPSFFSDYYDANAYDINSIYVTRIRCKPHKVKSRRDWTSGDYLTRDFRKHGIGVLDRAYYEVFCVVTKNENSVADVIPQQGRYKSIWQRRAAGAPARVKAGLFKKVARKLKGAG